MTKFSLFFLHLTFADKIISLLSSTMEIIWQRTRKYLSHFYYDVSGLPEREHFEQEAKIMFKF